jgi:hypothetical protein
MWLCAPAVAFRVLDDDNDGVLSAPDLFFFYKWLLGGAYSDVQLSEVRRAGSCRLGGRRCTRAASGIAW